MELIYCLILSGAIWKCGLSSFISVHLQMEMPIWTDCVFPKREQRESDSSPGGDGVVSQVNIDTAYVPHAVCAVLSHFSHV